MTDEMDAVKSLTKLEKAILDELDSSKPNTVSRDILNQVIDPDGYPQSNVLDVHIKNMRRKGIAIETVRGEGYRRS